MYLLAISRLKGTLKLIPSFHFKAHNTVNNNTLTNDDLCAHNWFIRHLPKQKTQGHKQQALNIQCFVECGLHFRI